MKKQQTSECITVWVLPVPSAHSSGCVWHWQEAIGEISGDALNALMQSNCFQISHWWTVSFQHLTTSHTHIHPSKVLVSCAKSGHRYDVLCLTLDLWPVILKCHCIVNHWGGQDGGLIWDRKSWPEIKERGRWRLIDIYPNKPILIKGVDKSWKVIHIWASFFLFLLLEAEVMKCEGYLKQQWHPVSAQSCALHLISYRRWMYETEDKWDERKKS